MSAAVLQQLTTLSTLYLTDVVQTGSRAIDNSLIALAAMVFGLAMNTLVTNWRQYYNCVIYHLYRMRYHPFELRRAPYSIPSRTTFNQVEDIYKHTYRIHLMWNTPPEVDMYDPEYVNAIARFINMNNLTPIFNVNGVKLLENFNVGATNNSKFKGIYIIDIDSNGEPIYYSNESHCILVSDSSGSPQDYVTKFCYKIRDIVREEKNKTKMVYDAIYVPSGKDEGSLQKVGSVNKKKTFDSLFFSQKKELLEVLNKFQTKTMYPSHIGMDTKLGILLYGPPGTGKTGTITAIANMLQRNIIIINFTSVTTCGQLDALLTPERFKDHIFVFDEFDCILDALGGTNREAKEEKNDWGTMLLAAEGEERKQILTMMREGKKVTKDQPIDMAYLLQKLDGIVSAEDRMIIATTNNPDKINSALLRPGRFDLKLCLGPCTRAMVCDILAYYYKDIEGVQGRVAAVRLPDSVITPLELVNLAMQKESLDAVLKHLSAVAAGGGRGAQFKKA